MEIVKPPIMACFPLYPPEELFAAFNFNPITIWGTEIRVADLNEANKHLEVFTCRVARRLVQNIYEQAVEKKNGVAGIFFYNACDTLRNTPEILQTALNNAKAASIPFFNIHIPQTNLIPERAKQYLRKEIQTLIQKIEDKFGVKFNLDCFNQSVGLYHEYRSLLRELDNKVSQEDLSFRNFITLHNSIALAPVKEKIENLKRFITGEMVKKSITEKKSEIKSPRILVSGILPPPYPILEVIEKAGLVIVGNDIATLSRTYYNNPAQTSNPGDYYVDLYFNHIPCPTLLTSSEQRIDYLIRLCHEKHANGLIFLAEKYCEYENFEFPIIIKNLREKGIASLELEFHLEESENSESYKTRIEEFAAILKGG